MHADLHYNSNGIPSVTKHYNRRYELHSTLALNMGNIKPFSQSENDNTVLEVKSITKTHK